MSNYEEVMDLLLRARRLLLNDYLDAPKDSVQSDISLQTHRDVDKALHVYLEARNLAVVEGKI